ncbi:MAG TPA: hypothetical protein VFX09_00665, partial [Burkholderiales bacterium]|nr:hypothetical protein [Burkholderiales bacterium]
MAALLVALYAGAACWLAPRFIRDGLARQAEQRQVDARLGKVRINPFTLRLDLQDVQLVSADGRTRAELPDCVIDVAWASLWKRTWVVQHASLRDARLEFAADTGKPGLQLRLRGLALQLGAFSTAQAAPVPAELQADWSLAGAGAPGAGGRLSATAKLAWSGEQPGVS